MQSCQNKIIVFDCCGHKTIMLNVCGMILFNFWASQAQLQLFQKIFRDRQSSLEVNFPQTYLRWAHGVNLAADLCREYSLEHFAHYQGMTFNNFTCKPTNYCPPLPCAVVPWQILNWLHLQMQTQKHTSRPHSGGIRAHLSQRALNTSALLLRVRQEPSDPFIKHRKLLII